MTDPTHGRIDTANRQWLSPSTSTCTSAHPVPMVNSPGDILLHRAGHPHGANCHPCGSNAAACVHGIARLHSDKELATAYEIKIPIPVSWAMRSETALPSAACAPKAEVGGSSEAAARCGAQRPLKLYTLTSVRPPVSVITEAPGNERGEEQPPLGSSRPRRLSHQQWQPPPADELQQQQQHHPISATQFRRVYSQDGLSSGTAIDGDADGCDTAKILRAYVYGPPVCSRDPKPVRNSNASERSPTPPLANLPPHSRPPRAMCGGVVPTVGLHRAVVVQQMPHAYWDAAVEDDIQRGEGVGEFKAAYSEEKAVASLPRQSGLGSLPGGLMIHAAPACHGAASRPVRGADGLDGSCYLQQQQQQQPIAHEADEVSYQTYDEACAKQRQRRRQRQQQQIMVPRMSGRLVINPQSASQRFAGGVRGMSSTLVEVAEDAGQATNAKDVVIVAATMAPARSGQQTRVPARRESQHGPDELVAAEAMAAGPATGAEESSRCASMMTCIDWDLCARDGRTRVADTASGGQGMRVRRQGVALDTGAAGGAGGFRMPDFVAGAGLRSSISAGGIATSGGLRHDSVSSSSALTVPSSPPAGSFLAGQQPLQQHRAHDALLCSGSENQQRKQLKLYPLGLGTRSAKSPPLSLQPQPPQPQPPERCHPSGFHRHRNSQVRCAAAAHARPQQHEFPDAMEPTVNASALDFVVWDLEPVRVAEETGCSGDGHGVATERSEGSAGTNIEPLTLPEATMPLPPPPPQQQQQQQQQHDCTSQNLHVGPGQNEELPLPTALAAQLESIASQAVQLWMHGHRVTDDIDVLATLNNGIQCPQGRLCKGGRCRGNSEAEAKATPHLMGQPHGSHQFNNELACHGAGQDGRGDVHGECVVDLTADTDTDGDERHGAGGGGGRDWSRGRAVRRPGEPISPEELYVLPAGHGLPLVVFGRGCKKRSRFAGAGGFGNGGESGEGAFPDDMVGRTSQECSGARTCFSSPSLRQRGPPRGQQRAGGAAPVNDDNQGEEEEEEEERHERSLQYQQKQQKQKQQRGTGRRGRPPWPPRSRRGGIKRDLTHVVGLSPGLPPVIPAITDQQAAAGVSTGARDLGAEPLPLEVSEPDIVRAHVPPGPPAAATTTMIVHPGWLGVERNEGYGRPRGEGGVTMEQGTGLALHGMQSVDAANSRRGLHVASDRQGLRRGRGRPRKRVWGRGRRG